VCALDAQQVEIAPDVAEDEIGADATSLLRVGREAPGRGGMRGVAPSNCGS